MLQAFKKDLQLNWTEICTIPVFTGAGFLFGQLMLAIIFAIEGPDEWFPMSTLMAAIIGVVCLFFLDGIGFAQKYSLAITMSRTRKPQLGAALLAAVLHATILAILLWLAASLDLLIGKWFYIGIDEAPADLLRAMIRRPWILLLPALPLSCMALFSGALHGRVGRKASSVIYIFFLCSCNLISPLIDYIQSRPNSVIARFFAWCGTLHPAVWIVLILVIMAILLFSAMRMLYKLQANL